MSNKQHGFIRQRPNETVGEYMFPHAAIQSTEGVIQQVDVPIWVQRTRQADSLFLTTAQVCPSLSDLKWKNGMMVRVDVGECIDICKTWMYFLT